MLFDMLVKYTLIVGLIIVAGLSFVLRFVSVFSELGGDGSCASFRSFFEP